MQHSKISMIQVGVAYNVPLKSIPTKKFVTIKCLIKLIFTLRTLRRLCWPRWIK